MGEFSSLPWWINSAEVNSFWQRCNIDHFCSIARYMKCVCICHLEARNSIDAPRKLVRDRHCGRVATGQLQLGGLEVPGLQG